MEQINFVALVVAFLGAGGLGVFIREVADVVTKVRSGVSAKESKRKNDLVSQRDYEYERAETESAARRILAEYASILRRLLIENGLDEFLPPWPELPKAKPRPTTIIDPKKETP